eukprot:Seg1703.7 transcript_id=Seg1703.7/GoldUCD/mRNA.D3Y31 product="hypothetical protein" protein_id=Seg1703.7/GoldUCD/D3Y31
MAQSDSFAAKKTDVCKLEVANESGTNDFAQKFPYHGTAMFNISDRFDDVNTYESVCNNNHEKIIGKTMCPEADRNPESADCVIQNESECILHRVYQRHPTLADIDERFEEIAFLLEKFILVDEEQIVPSKGKCFLLGLQEEKISTPEDIYQFALSLPLPFDFNEDNEDSFSHGMESELYEGSVAVNGQEIVGRRELSDRMLNPTTAALSHFPVPEEDSYTVPEEILERVTELTNKVRDRPSMLQTLQSPRKKEFDEDSTYESSSDWSEFEDDEDNPQQEIFEEVTKFLTEVRGRTTEPQDLLNKELEDHNTGGLTSTQLGCSSLEKAESGTDGRLADGDSTFISHIKQGSNFYQDSLEYAASLPLPVDVVIDEKDSDWDEESNCDDCRFNDIKEMEQFLETTEAAATAIQSVEDVERVYVEFGISQNAIIEQSFCQDETESGEAPKHLHDMQQKEINSDELTESVTLSLAKSLSLQDVEPPNDCDELVSLFQTSFACTEPDYVNKADLAAEPPVVSVQQYQPHVQEKCQMQEPSLPHNQSLLAMQEQVNDVRSWMLMSPMSSIECLLCQLQMNASPSCRAEQSLPQFNANPVLDADVANSDRMYSMPASDDCQPLVPCRGQHNLMQEQCQLPLQDPSLPQEQSLPVMREQFNANPVFDADVANFDRMSSMPAPDVCQPLVPCRGQHNLMQEQCQLPLQDLSLPQEQSLPVMREQFNANAVFDADVANFDRMSSMPASDDCQPLVPCQGQHNLMQEQCQLPLQDLSLPQEQSLPVMREQFNANTVFDADVANFDRMSSMPASDDCQPLVPCQDQHNLMQEQCRFQLPESSLHQEQSLSAMQEQVNAGKILHADIADVNRMSSMPAPDVCQPLMPCQGQHNLMQQQCQFEMPKPSLTQEQSVPVMQEQVNGGQILDADVNNVHRMSSMPAPDVFQPVVQCQGQQNVTQEQFQLQEPSLPQEQSVPAMQEQLTAGQILDAGAASVDRMSSVSAPDEQVNFDQIADAEHANMNVLSSMPAPGIRQPLLQQQCQFQLQESSLPQDQSLAATQQQVNAGQILDAHLTNVDRMSSVPVQDVCQPLVQDQCQFHLPEPSQPQNQSLPVMQEQINAGQNLDAEKAISEACAQNAKSRKKRFLPSQRSQDSDSENESHSPVNAKRTQVSKSRCDIGKGVVNHSKRGLNTFQEGNSVMQRKRTRSKMSLNKSPELNIQQKTLCTVPPQQTASDCRNIDEDFANLITKSVESFNKDTVEMQQSQQLEENLFTVAAQGISVQGPPTEVPVAEMPAAEEPAAEEPAAEEPAAQSSMADDQGYDSVDDELAELFSKSFKSLNVENDDGCSQGDNKRKKQRVSLQIPQLPVTNQQLIRPSSFSFSQLSQPRRQYQIPILQLAEMPEPVQMEQQNMVLVPACFSAQNVPAVIQPNWPNFTGVFTNHFAPTFNNVMSRTEHPSMFAHQATTQDEAMSVLAGAETEASVENDFSMATEPAINSSNQRDASKEHVIFTSNCYMPEHNTERLNADDLLAALSDSLEPTTVNATAGSEILTVLDANSEKITEETNHSDHCIVVSKWERAWPEQETEMEPALDDTSTTVIDVMPCLNALEASPRKELSNQDSAPTVSCMSRDEKHPEIPSESSASDASCGIIGISKKFCRGQEGLDDSTVIASAPYLLDCHGEKYETKKLCQSSESCAGVRQTKLSLASDESYGTVSLSTQSTQNEDAVNDSTVIAFDSYLLDCSGDEDEATETVNSCTGVELKTSSLASDESYGTVNLSKQSTQKEDVVNDSSVITCTSYLLDCNGDKKKAKEPHQNDESYTEVRLTELSKQRKRKFTDEDCEDHKETAASKKQKLDSFTFMKFSVVEIGKSNGRKREAILIEEENFREQPAAKKQRLDIFALIKLGLFNIGESGLRKRKATDVDEEDFGETPRKRCRTEASVTSRTEKKAGGRRDNSQSATQRRFKIKRSSVARATA